MLSLPYLCASRPLTADDFQSTMDGLQADAAAVWAILTVESGKAGYLADRRPQILFERAQFHTRTKGAYDVTNAGISAPTWGGYSGGAAEYARLGEAYELDAEAALLSASWGLAQIMGFNHTLAGYGSVTEFVQDMCASEGAQLRAFESFLGKSGIDRDLSRHDWRTVALKFNGPGQRDKYAKLLEEAYGRLSAPGGLPVLDVRAVQLLLSFLARQTGNDGLKPGAIDGHAGAHTLQALNAFLDGQGLSAVSVVDAGVVERLQDALAPGEELALG